MKPPKWRPVRCGGTAGKRWRYAIASRSPAMAPARAHPDRANGSGGSPASYGDAIVPVRYFALIYGVVFLVVGVAGFVPGLVVPVAPPAEAPVDTGFGRLFGLFSINWLHNLVHIAFGIWGLAAYRSFPRPGCTPAPLRSSTAS
jgi:Domain of unknown function (DUF4383)